MWKKNTTSNTFIRIQCPIGLTCFIHDWMIETSLTWTDLDLLERTQGLILPRIPTFSDLNPCRIRDWCWNNLVSNTRVEWLSSLVEQRQRKNETCRGSRELLLKRQENRCCRAQPKQWSLFALIAEPVLNTEYTGIICITVQSAVFKPIRGKKNTECGTVNTSNGLWKRARRESASVCFLHLGGVRVHVCTTASDFTALSTSAGIDPARSPRWPRCLQHTRNRHIFL